MRRFISACLRLLCLALWAGCGGSDPTPDPSRQPPAAADAPPDAGTDPLFVDEAPSRGLDFVHFNGMSGEYYLPEITGSGAALFDYDNDGDLDLYLLQGHLLGEGKSMADALLVPALPPPFKDRLYRNELQAQPDGGRGFRFTDVTQESGLEAKGYGMGVASGDFDNDGWTDLYVTNFGANELWRNRGDGTFTNVTSTTGVGEDRWSVAAVFFDYDRDGWLDLYVGNYLAMDYDNHKICRAVTGARDYCAPTAYEGEPDRLLRNRGDGTFEDTTRRAGLARASAATLGAVAADLNNDGWLDLYVANDGEPNQLWINQGDGTFGNEALLAGCAVNGHGLAEASMGVDAGDFDGDGDPDLFLTHLTGETNTLYVNEGRGTFDDATRPSGLGSPSQAATAFGTAWFDYDNDGWLDLVAANGAVRTLEELARKQDPFPFHQTNQLFRNLGDGSFEETTGRAGAAFRQSDTSRGAAFGDLDNDGDVDLVMVSNSGPVRLLLNQVGNRNPWLGLRLVGGWVPRDMLGARVALLRAGAPPLWRRVRTDGGYASAHDPRVLFGLGGERRVEGVRVLWPDGSQEEWTGLAAETYTTLRQGEGKAGGRTDVSP